MILFAESAIAGFLSELLRAPGYQVLAIPLALNRLGEQLFGIQNQVFNLQWEWALVVIVAVTLLTALALMLKIRRAEVAS
jgi:hypothetical protein